MKTAKFISETQLKTGMGYTATQQLYKLSQPLSGFDYVVVSAVYTSDHGEETYIFGSDETGEIKSFSDLEGSFVGSLGHHRALRNAGYKVE